MINNILSRAQLSGKLMPITITIAFLSLCFARVSLGNEPPQQQALLSDLNSLNSLDFAIDEQTIAAFGTNNEEDSNININKSNNSMDKRQAIVQPKALDGETTANTGSQIISLSTDNNSRLTRDNADISKFSGQNTGSSIKFVEPRHQNSSLQASITLNGKANLVGGKQQKSRKARKTNNKRRRTIQVSSPNMSAANAKQTSFVQAIMSLMSQLETLDLKKMLKPTDDIRLPFANTFNSQALLKTIQHHLFDSNNFKAMPNVSFSSSKNISNPLYNNITKNIPAFSSLKQNQKSLDTLLADTSNLFSVTNQFVKLARHQIGNDLFGWPSTLFASQSQHHHGLSGTDFTSAALKSDLFWFVVPAVIVVGAGVIILPLIAAKIVSGLLSQGTFTVSAGKRRKRRDLTTDISSNLKVATHSLDEIAQQLFTDDLLIKQLSKFGSILQNAQNTINMMSTNDKMVETGLKQIDNNNS